MKVLQINGGVFGSTGKIMFGIAHLLQTNNELVVCASPITSTNRKKSPKENYIKIGSYRSRQLSVLLGRITGLEDCFAFFSTINLILKIKKFDPTIIHFHNIHGSFINLPLLLNFIKIKKIPVVWTLHDCWAFTGHCTYFTMANCNKWKEKCNHCPQYNNYPKSYFDNSKVMFNKKKKWFQNIPKMILVTPSAWLAQLVKQSFLKEYPIEIINNGIDLNVFKPTNSSFRTQFGIKKFIVLSVAFDWGKRKGLDIMVKLAKDLPLDYQIVLVGTTDLIDKELPTNIISIHRTENQVQLAQIYSSADLFVIPTREDNYPTVNMEALACGTPVLTFAVGGSPEMVDCTCGRVVDSEDYGTLLREIIRICEGSTFSKSDCVKHALVFDEKKRYADYYSLYHRIEKGIYY